MMTSSDAPTAAADRRSTGPRAPAGDLTLELLLQRAERTGVGALHHLDHGVVGLDVPRDERTAARGHHGDGGAVHLGLHVTVDDPVRERAAFLVARELPLDDAHAEHAEDAVVAVELATLDPGHPHEIAEVADLRPHVVGRSVDRDLGPCFAHRWCSFGMRSLCRHGVVSRTRDT